MISSQLYFRDDFFEQKETPDIGFAVAREIKPAE
jgi:hypothetical protein